MSALNGPPMKTIKEYEIEIEDYFKEFVQIGPNKLHAYSSQMFLINDNPFPYRLEDSAILWIHRNKRLTEQVDSPKNRFIEIFSWNETLTYGEKFGQMTYLSQTLLISDITVDYAEYDESMQFRMISNMFPSGEYECPR